MVNGRSGRSVSQADLDQQVNIPLVDDHQSVAGSNYLAASVA